MDTTLIEIERIYSLYREAKAVKLPHDLEVDRVVKGDMYIAWKKGLGKGKRALLMKSIRFMEFRFPNLLRFLFRTFKKFNDTASLVVDGNAFAQAALSKGATYAVIDNARINKSDRFLLVQDTRKSLDELALLHRKHLQAHIVGITGSCGKTTTKELVKTVLSTKYSTDSTIENYNCKPFISQKILNIHEDSQMAIIEMGVNGVGEIEEYCNVVQPNSGIITSIGKAHLLGFKSIEGVTKAKGELFDYLISSQGHIFKNLNDKIVKNLATDYKNITTYGCDPEADIYGEIHSIFPYLIIKWYPTKRSTKEFYILASKLYGAYNLDNILAAIAVGLYYEIPPKLINESIQEYETLSLRSQVQNIGTNVFIFDSYNANPTSMRAALNNFSDLKATNKIAILGSMLELGSFSRNEHVELIRYVKSLKFDTTVFIGKEFKEVADNSYGIYFSNSKSAQKWFNKMNFTNAHILLKGSRGIAVEKIIKK